jgi:hypothetical protein
LSDDNNKIGKLSAPAPGGKQKIPHDGVVVRCNHGSVARIVWSVREGKVGEVDAPELSADYRSAHPVREPKIGEILALPDGSGPWRVVDWMLTDHVDSPGNVLIVERDA